MKVDIQTHTLENGLRINLAQDQSQPVVAVNLWYNVGSRNERRGRTGFAHLFEHMMFQGSENVPDTEHIAFVERVGGSMNGSTWLDRTNYFETVPSNRLELALWLESDRMGFLLPAMTQEKLDNQRDVVKNERRWRIDNQPYGDWIEQIQELMYPADHPYQHSVIGSMEDLDAATLDDVKEFFSTYYSPNNAVLTICGDFEPSTALSLINSYFGDLPAGPPPPPIPGRTELPPTLGGERRKVIESEVPLARVHASYRIPAYGKADFYPADVVAHLLANGKASRLYRSLVRDQRLAKGVVAYAFPVVTGAAIMVVWATANPGVDPDGLERALMAEIGKLAEDGCTEAELERVVTTIVARETISLQRVGERADQISMFTTLFDDPGRINREIDYYRAVTCEDVQRFAGEYLGADNRAILTYLPAAKAEAA